LAWVVPNGADFEQFDALALQAKAEVELAADVGRGAMRLDEPVNGFFDAFAFEFVKGHELCLWLLGYRAGSAWRLLIFWRDVFV
jgi:hypothetical protein